MAPEVPVDHDHQALRLFLCGDVMPGRGIDQVLPQSCDPALHEPWVKDARVYRQLAEAENGPIPAPVDHDYVWGDALAWLERFAPDRRLINLETAVTCSDDAWPGKGVHYRMHPSNVGVITAAGIDACSLANNHVLDWGYAGLDETLASLDNAGVAIAGAGQDLAAASAPVALDTDTKGRVILLALGSTSSGVPSEWAARSERPGVWLVDEARQHAVDTVARRVAEFKRNGDVVVVSIHWGSNWGYRIPNAQRRFAHALIGAGVDVVHGHSSHHPRGIEVHRGRLVLYGCGDFVNDYEGIGGHTEYRPELTLMYFVDLEPDSGRLRNLALRPMRIRRFQLVDANAGDAAWLAARLDRECRKLGAGVERDDDGTFRLMWG